MQVKIYLIINNLILMPMTIKIMVYLIILWKINSLVQVNRKSIKKIVIKRNYNILKISQLISIRIRICILHLNYWNNVVVFLKILSMILEEIRFKPIDQAILKVLMLLNKFNVLTIILRYYSLHNNLIQVFLAI